jgi:hypothetical protein
MSHLKSPLLRAMAPMVDEIRMTFRSLGIFEFLPSHEMMVKFGMKTCQRESSSIREVCANALFLLCGYDSTQLNRTLVAEIARHTPAGNEIS